MGKFLMGAREIEERLGVSRQRVQQLIGGKGFPEPYDELAMGKVWDKRDIEGWILRRRPHNILPGDLPDALADDEL